MSTICIVTSELYGFFKNGGIGTANYGIAKALASAGNEVTVLLLEANNYSESVIEKYKKIQYKKL